MQLLESFSFISIVSVFSVLSLSLIWNDNTTRKKIVMERMLVLKNAVAKAVVLLKSRKATLFKEMKAINSMKKQLGSLAMSRSSYIRHILTSWWKKWLDYWWLLLGWLILLSVFTGSRSLKWISLKTTSFLPNLRSISTT